jgi:orotidine-5'-phosphate decarboxylase
LFLYGILALVRIQGDIMGKDVIVACDFSNKEEVIGFLSKFKEEKPFVKIGMELFYGEGPEIVKIISSMGHKIFLDLKLHDIPNTVYKAMRVLSAWPIDMVNVHAAGTLPMMEAALQGLTRHDGTRPLLVAVTQLTSTDRERMKSDILIDRPMEEVVIHYARCAKKAGLDGVVCSPLEAGMVHDACGKEFLTVTPGVRFAENDAGDQKRVTSPAMARVLGSDYIVVGRPVTLAEDPFEAYRRCIREFIG